MIFWLMPDIHRGPAGTPMIFHMSFGIIDLVLIIVRLIWRITHFVPQDNSLPAWQRVAAESVHGCSMYGAPDNDFRLAECLI